MTAAKKTGIAGGITIAGIVAVLALWPQVRPIADWLVTNAGVILEREQVQAVMAASAIGVFVNASLPYALPASMSRIVTRTIAGWAGFILTLAAAWSLVPTRVGFVYAVLAATATPTATAVIRETVYWIRPATQPNSLR